MIQAGHINARPLKILLASMLIFSCTATSSLHAQTASTESEEARLQTQTQSDSARHPSPDPGPQSGRITGTVTDVNYLPIPGALVNLHASDSDDVRSATTDENGFYQFLTVEPRHAYQISIRAAGFAQWDSPVVTVDAGQSTIVDVPKLRIEEVQTSITVTPANSHDIATAQVKAEEKQRGFGIIPNFYAAYDPNPAPMNAGLKFRLALRVARDPFTFTGVAILAGIGQATDNPAFVQGARGYGERFGVNYANSFTDIMLDGAILPSILHQDPRYFYQGTGASKSRVAHVISSLFVTKGENGKWQPNYSALGGDLASSAISNLYYPSSNRGAGLVFKGFATITAIHLAVRMLDEFVFRPAKGSVAE
jgi:Carboxypeptidase regulatory-like domain